MTEFNKPSPEKEQPLRVPDLFKMLGRAALYGCTHLDSIRNRPPTLFGVMEEEVAASPQPLHPDIATTIENTREMLTKHAISTPERFSLSDKFMRNARMIQFTDRFAGSDQAFVHYDSMKTLKDRFVASAEHQAYPLGFDQQLDIALELSGSDSIEGLTNLWFASRQYARWFDSVSIHDLSEFAPAEILMEMKEWRSSILACKNAEDGDFQDTSGDSYYAWTHALARVMYGSGTSAADRIGKYVFSHGTAINSHTHKFIKQSIPSNHTVAAAYGNRIGDAVLDAMETN